MNDTSHVKLAPINILSPFEFELSLSFFLSKFLKSLSRADYSIWKKNIVAIALTQSQNRDVF